MTHGYDVQIDPASNPNYFTGAAYSAHLNDAKVFRTPRGAMRATHYWQFADHGRMIPWDWFHARQAVEVSLVISQGELL
jgi:hypothetical protein